MDQWNLPDRHSSIAAVVVALVLVALVPGGSEAQCNPIFNPCDVHVFLPVAVREPRPTATPLPTPEPTATPASFRQLDPRNIIKAFRVAGLEAENAHLEDPAARGLVPRVCDAWRFIIPSIGYDSGGRVYDCANQNDLNTIIEYHVEVCNWFRAWCPWRASRHNLFLMINSDLPEATADRYIDVFHRAQ